MDSRNCFQAWPNLIGSARDTHIRACHHSNDSSHVSPRLMHPTLCPSQPRSGKASPRRTIFMLNQTRDRQLPLAASNVNRPLGSSERERLCSVVLAPEGHQHTNHRSTHASSHLAGGGIKPPRRPHRVRLATRPKPGVYSPGLLWSAGLCSGLTTCGQPCRRHAHACLAGSCYPFTLHPNH